MNGWLAFFVILQGKKKAITELDCLFKTTYVEFSSGLF